jgi:O-antigen ligase
VSYLVNGLPERGARLLGDRYILLLLFIPLFLLLRKHVAARQAIWWMFSAAALVAGVVALIDVFYLGKPRGSGMTHPVAFGKLSLTITLVAMLGYSYFRNRGFMAFCFYLISVGLGIAAVFLSETRGSWVVLLPAILMLLWVYFRETRVWKKVVITGLLLVISLSSYAVPTINERVNIAIDEIRAYLQAEEPTDARRQTGVGLRFEMWRAAWHMFWDNPLVGAGTGNYKTKAKELARTGSWHPDIATHKQPHNQYLSALCTQGVLGLVSLLLVLCVPAAIYLSYLRHPDAEIRTLAQAGLLVVVSYALFGITGVTLEHRNMIVVYAFSLALIYGMIRNKELPELLPLVDATQEEAADYKATPIS